MLVSEIIEMNDRPSEILIVDYQEVGEEKISLKVIIDAEDYPKVYNHLGKLRIKKQKNGNFLPAFFYVLYDKNGKKKKEIEPLHRCVMDSIPGDGCTIDHISEGEDMEPICWHKLDCRKSNLKRRMPKKNPSKNGKLDMYYLSTLQVDYRNAQNYIDFVTTDCPMDECARISLVAAAKDVRVAICAVVNSKPETRKNLVDELKKKKQILSISIFGLDKYITTSKQSIKYRRIYLNLE